MSLVYRLVRCLVALLAVLVQSDLSKDAELPCCATRIRCCAVSSAAACGGTMPAGSGLRRSPGW